MPLLRFVAMAIAKTLSKVFGLATMTFFGRMPSRDDDKMAFVGIASLTWLPIVVAAFVPAVAEVVIPFAPDDEEVTRRIAIASAVVLPLVIGAVVATLHNNRGQGWRSAAGRVVAGYWYATVIGLTVTALVVGVPILKASYLTRRFTTMRVLLMLPEDRYERTLDHMTDALAEQGIDVEVHRPHPIILHLFRALGYVLGRIFSRDVADDMRVLRGHDDDTWFEITLHPADMTIVARKRTASKLHAILADSIDERVVYLTWDDESQALEDRIRALREDLEAGQHVDPAAIDELVADLRELQLDQEEWNAVRRLLYRLDRDAARAVSTDG